MKKEKIKNFFLNLFFPKFCQGCGKEGEFLCPDCRATLEISQTHKKLLNKNISDLYFPLEYKRLLIKKLIQRFKYEPFIKGLAKDLASLIIAHFRLIDEPPPFLIKNWEFVLVPVPLEKRKLKWRGFNQAEELAKELSTFLKIPIISNCLIKIKENISQVELSKKEREENIKGVFKIEKSEKIRERKILLVDDIYTTGSTMAECARILKKAGAKEIIGIVIARAIPGQDRYKII